MKMGGYQAIILINLWGCYSSLQTGHQLEVLDCGQHNLNYNVTTERRLLSHSNFNRKTKYPNSRTCKWVVELGPTCLKQKLYCVYFRSLANKKCIKGDILKVSVAGKSKRFCKNKMPTKKKPIIARNKLAITWKTNKKKALTGFDCRIVCVEILETTTSTSAKTSTPTTSVATSTSTISNSTSIITTSISTISITTSISTSMTPSSSTTTFPTTSTKPMIFCPPGWALHVGDCYKHISEEKSWLEAQQHCSKEKGHLASVSTPEVNTFLSSLSPEYSWLGGSDLLTEGMWSWIEEVPFIWTNWSEGNPSNGIAVGRGQHCLATNWLITGRWDDGFCDKKLPFFCLLGPPNICFREQYTSYHGSDIAIEVKEGEDECADWCGQTPDCRFWSFTKSDRKCWLKSYVFERRNNDGTISGTKSCAKRCVKENNINYYGSDIGKKICDGQEECANWCGEIQACKFWTFRKSDKKCWIKTSDSDRRINTDKISGSKSCTEGCLFEASAPMFSASYDVSSPSLQWTFTFLTNPAKVPNTVSWPTYSWSPDGHLSSIFNPIPGVWYHFQPNSQTFRASGPGPLPQNMQQLSPDKTVLGGRLKHDAYNSGGEWLMAVHQTGNPGFLTGFLHVEDQFRDLGQAGGGPAFKSIALACSSNWGQTWSKRGRIITSGTKPSKVRFTGTGDMDVVWDWQEARWIMIMQNKKEKEKGGSKLTASVSYDKSAAADSWRKWDGEDFTVSNWEKPGEHLRDTEGNRTLKGGANPSVHWNTYLQLWVMVYGGWDGNTYITSAKQLPYFSPSRVLVEGNQSIKNWYPTLMSAENGDREGGQILHLYYRKRYMTNNTSDFIAVKIKLSRQ